MTVHFKDRSAASITPDEAQDWISSLIGTKRSARTVKKNWIAASKTVFGWGVEHKYLPRNPFATVKVTFPQSVKLRETQAFRPEERRTILKAALAITDTDTPDKAARRWVPWLAAYTGARPGGGLTTTRSSGTTSRLASRCRTPLPSPSSAVCGTSRSMRPCSAHSYTPAPCWKPGAPITTTTGHTRGSAG